MGEYWLPDAGIACLTWMCRPGSIVVLHDGGGDRSRSIGAVPPIIDTLRSRGFRFVTLDELMPGR